MPTKPLSIAQTSDAMIALATREHRSCKWTVEPGQIGAGIAEADFGTAPEVTRALQHAIANNFTSYLPHDVALETQAATAEFYERRFGVPVDAGRVHLVHDVMTAFRLTLLHFTSPGARVIVPTPAYSPFLEIPKQYGLGVSELQMLVRDGRWTFDFTELDRLLAEGPALFVLCNPHNPLGFVHTRLELERLNELFVRHDVRVFSDEIHAPVMPATPMTPFVPYASVSPSAAAHTITAIACSKGWNIAGLKMAQVILSNEADQQLWNSLNLSPTHLASALGSVAAIAAYREGERWLDESNARHEKHLEIVAAWIRDTGLPIGFIPPEATFLAWLDLRRFQAPDARRIADYVIEESRVMFSDGLASGAAGEGHVRLNVALPEDILRLALERLRLVLEELTVMPQA